MSFLHTTELLLILSVPMIRYCLSGDARKFVDVEHRIGEVLVAIIDEAGDLVDV